MTFTAALVAFAAITFFVITVEIIYSYASKGFGYGFSSNRPIVEKSPLGLRIERTYRNQVESAAYIVPVLVVAELTSLQGPHIALATFLIVLGRAAFAVLYYTGIPFVRILGFSTASFACFYIGLMLVLSGSLVP